MFNNNFNNKAISLIEIIVTIAIAFLLSAIAIYSYQDYRIKALMNNALTIAEQNKLAVSNYYATNKSCPPNTSPNTFINQDVNKSQCLSTTTSPCVRTIINDDPSSGCIVNLKDQNDKIVMYFKAMLSPVVGELKYFCFLGPNPVPNKYLSITCPDPPEASNGFSLP